MGGLAVVGGKRARHNGGRWMRLAQRTEDFMNALSRSVGSSIITIAALIASSSLAHAQTSDPPKQPVPAPRDCSALHPGAVFTGTQDYDPTSPDWTGYAYPWNLVYKEWMRVGGPSGPIGCPVGQVVTDGDGGYVQFEHGQIAVSPGVWEQGVVAAYQDNLTGNGIIVDWTVSWEEPNPPSHFNYSKFVVRWDYNGQHFDDGKPCERGDGDQCDVLADMTEIQAVLLHYFHDTHLRTKGTFVLPVDHGDGNYRIAIEGCDEGVVGGSTCRQGWMHPVEVAFDTRTTAQGGSVPEGGPDYPIDLTKVPTATDAASSQAAFFQRAAAITLHNACLPLLRYSAYRNEEDYMSTVLAKLDYANYYQEDKCPGRVIENRPEAFESLRRQQVDSRAGTTIDSCPGCRTGEYDVALAGYTAIVGRFGGSLPSDVYGHIVNDLLNKQGRLDMGDHSVSVGIPESENHINMIESARYLTNDLLYARTGDSQYDNATNTAFVLDIGYETEQCTTLCVSGLPSPLAITMRDYWLRRLHHVLQTDFIEYNARPYQGYTMRAIQNLYSYAREGDPVKTLAGMVLDYVSAKVAASSNDLRRAVPYRRKAEYNDPALIGFHADPQSARMMALAGNLDILKQSPRHDFYAHWYGRPDMEMAVISAYRVPEPILDVMLKPGHRIFYQGLHHYADEIYAASPSLLLSGGGHYATFAYTFLGTGKHDDIGMALPTTVMPKGFFLSRNDLIRFEGKSDDAQRSNMCVAPEFACGIAPVLPDAMSSALRPGCVATNGPWTFINFTSACRSSQDNAPAGFYAALYQRSDTALDGERLSSGFVEVFDTQVNPAVTFDEFRTHVLDVNGTRRYQTFARNNVYVTITGREISFELAPDSRILQIVNGPKPAQGTSDMATGTLIQSAGTSALLTITNGYTGKQLTLDDSNLFHPVLSAATIPAFGADACLSGFAWRLADSTDHVCVTADRAKQTQLENMVASAHVVPGTADTCKQNFVWRQADSADHVCVQPASRDAAQWDNKLRPSRMAAPLL
jgi:hypothetical protein